MYVLIIILFVIAILIVVFAKAFKDVTAELKITEGIADNPQSIYTIEKAEKGSVDLLDYLFLGVFIAMFLSIIISSVYIDVHPVFIIAFILAWIAIIPVSAIMANAYTEIIEQEELESTASEFTYSRIIMEKYPIILFALGILVMIIIYGKARKPTVEV